jgi:beta-glucosidase
MASSYAPRKGMTKTEIDEHVDAILREATLEEKVAMMSGRGFFKQYNESGRVWGASPYRAGGGCERLDVPPLYFTDGPRGVARGQSTCFPCTMARGASFDVDLERRIGEIMGIEARAQGCTLSGAVCVNLLRHPAWGRAQETYGEDPHHLGEMGAALAQGIQTHNVIATVKHFALNSMENARFKVDVRCDDRTMREVYLPHFKRILDAGCASVMSAYNKYNGEYCGENRDLLTGILRDEWGFDGFVHSDWIMGVHKVEGAAAGLDVENPEPRVFGAHLVEAAQSGQAALEVIDRACRRILTTTYRFACAEDPIAYTPALVARAEHRAVAYEAACKSAVLLKNDNVLPLDCGALKSIAVLGRLADLNNTGDNGSSRVRPPYVITPLEGLKANLGDAVTIRTGDESNLAAAKQVARGSDVVVVVVGYTATEEGEFIPGEMGVGAGAAGASFGRGGDRADLGLPSDQVALIKAAACAGKPLLVVLIAGSAVLVEPWIEDAGAVLQTFYAGMEGGAALAQIVFGEVSPSGRLPFTVAREPGDYPFFDADADAIEYGPLHGYTLLEANDIAPRFGFGHGLSYARFEYTNLSAILTDQAVEISVDVRNASDVTAEEVVLVFVSPPGEAISRPQRLLKVFARVPLQGGESRTVRLVVSLQSLKYWDPATRAWRLEAGDHVISVQPRAGVGPTVRLSIPA